MSGEYTAEEIESAKVVSDLAEKIVSGLTVMSESIHPGLVAAAAVSGSLAFAAGNSIDRAQLQTLVDGILDDMYGETA